MQGVARSNHAVLTNENNSLYKKACVFHSKVASQNYANRPPILIFETSERLLSFSVSDGERQIMNENFRPSSRS
jgi:hypothetical protein